VSDVDAWVEAGLYDPDAANAPLRRELLEHLSERGVSIEEMLQADAMRGLTAAASDRLLTSPRTLSRDEAAARVGLTAEQVDRAWMAVGLPALPEDGPACSEGDLLLLAAFAAGMELLGFEAALQFSRVIGTSLARIADAAITGFLVNVERPLNIEHARPVELARVSEEGTSILVSMPEFFGPLFLHHAALANARSRATREGPTSFAEYRLSVGFLDLVDFTAWSEGLTAEQLAHAVNEFEEAASDRITPSGARVVKSIGDAIMFVSPDAATACRVALDLCGFVDAHPLLTRLRGAVTSGTLLSRDGDYFGPTVNRAARLVKEALPGTLVSDAPVEGFDCEAIGVRVLRGMNEPVPLYRVS
jgi:class 3 adenylate cyclase